MICIIRKQHHGTTPTTSNYISVWSVLLKNKTMEQHQQGRQQPVQYRNQICYRSKLLQSIHTTDKVRYTSFRQISMYVQYTICMILNVACTDILVKKQTLPSHGKLPRNIHLYHLYHLNDLSRVLRSWKVKKQITPSFFRSHGQNLTQWWYHIGLYTIDTINKKKTCKYNTTPQASRDYCSILHPAHQHLYPRSPPSRCPNHY